MRGYAAVAVESIKFEENLGGVIRAAFLYSAALVVIGPTRYKHISTDTYKAYRHMPVLHAMDMDILDFLPVDCVPVAVELVDGATQLQRFHHPERAYYIFGGEDRTLQPSLLSRCAYTVSIPTRGSMNLAACVNVVLYDRLLKKQSLLDDAQVKGVNWHEWPMDRRDAHCASRRPTQREF